MNKIIANRLYIIIFFLRFINGRNIISNKDNIKIVIQFNLKKYNNNKNIMNKNDFCNNIKYFLPGLSSSSVYLAMIIPIIKARKTTTTDNK